MAIEIERKFLLSDDRWRGEVSEAKRYRQGYVTAGEGTNVRIRTSADQAWLTLKGPTEGVSRAEFEYSIPLDDANQMLDTLCQRPLVEKTRHIVSHAGHRWEIDEFEGDNAGLVVAEVELSSADEALSLPVWIGSEVSGVERYFNAALVARPYREWSEAERAA